jgi:hypothetical protein
MVSALPATGSTLDACKVAGEQRIVSVDGNDDSAVCE